MFLLFYTLMLMASGITMVVVGFAIKEQSTLARVANVVIGIAFFCYGFYLMFIFDGGRYEIFAYVFILPILLIVQAVKARKQAQEQAAAQQVAGPAQPGQFGYGQVPQQGYPAQPGQPAPQGQYGQPQGQPGQPTV